jgi:hypothetical protein
LCLGRGRCRVAGILCAGTARAAAGARRVLVGSVAVAGRDRDCRRQDVERDPGILLAVLSRLVLTAIIAVHVAARAAAAALEPGLAIALLGVGAGLAILARLAMFTNFANFTGLAGFAGRAIFAMFAMIAHFAPGTLFVAAAIVAVGDHHVVVAVFIVIIVVAVARTLIFEAGAVLVQNAKIMFGELQVIFALDAVAAKLRVTRELLVLFQKLGGVAPLPIVLAIAAGHVVRRASPAATAAPAAALTIVDQL